MDRDDIIREAKTQGFVVEIGAHLRFIPPAATLPDGTPTKAVFASKTPSDKRALQNMIRDLRRYAGFVWDPHSKKKGKR